MMGTQNVIVQPDDGTQPIVDLIRSAKSGILVKQFTFDHVGLLDELLEQHNRGIRIRVMLNAAKATGERINDAAYKKLETAGVPVQWSCPDFLVTHEKSVVVDGQKALLATFNFMEKYFKDTRDFGVVLTDPVSVQQIQECFDCDWERKQFHPRHSHQLAWSPGNARSLVCDLIDNARRSIDVQHPKFAEPVVFERLHAALKRGVAVRVLCGGKHGLHQPDLMYSFALWRILKDMGGKLHKQKNLRSHAKLILVDGAKALISSQNLDQPAFDARREVGVVVDDTASLKLLASVFEKDWDHSRKYDPPYPTEQLDDSEEAELFHASEVVHD